MSWSLRRAQARDIEPVARLWAESQGVDLDEMRARATRWFVLGREDLQLVAELDGEAVGWARAAHFDTTQIPDAPSNVVPPGWYLLGLNVDPRVRRQGIGRALTEARMAWLGERTEEVLYFTAAWNSASQRLHEAMGFTLVDPDVWFPGKRDPEIPVMLYRALVKGPASQELTP